jgi:hypothetical protein
MIDLSSNMALSNFIKSLTENMLKKVKGMKEIPE